ncbi:MAG: TIM-barrel domain-containing protein [Opitutaceae bacterium]
MLSSHSRLHGSSSCRVPWNFDDEACDVLRFFTKLKCRLMPYLFGAAVQAHQEGIPMMRAMILEFPDDPACDTLERQYMLGDALLVAPVLSDSGWVDFHLPAGGWTHLLTGERVEGGRWKRTQHDFFSLPVYVREGAILAFGARDDRPDFDYLENVTFRVYELADEAIGRCDVSSFQGHRVGGVEVRRSDCVYEVSGDLPADVIWEVQLVGVAGVESAEGGIVELDPAGAVITADGASKRLRILTTDSSARSG